MLGLAGKNALTSPPFTPKCQPRGCSTVTDPQPSFDLTSSSLITPMSSARVDTGEGKKFFQKFSPQYWKDRYFPCVITSGGAIKRASQRFWRMRMRTAPERLSFDGARSRDLPEG